MEEKDETRTTAFVGLGEHLTHWRDDEHTEAKKIPFWQCVCG